MLRRVMMACMAVGLVLGHSCSDITTTTLLCEDAAARIYSCCSTHAQISCVDSGCGESRPNFAAQVAKCIRNAGCDDIRQAGLCDVPDWQFSVSAVCSDGIATCPSDAGSDCSATIQSACAALGRLKCQ
jgi:hypothetical protein